MYDFDPGLPGVMTACGPYAPGVTTHFIAEMERSGVSTFIWWGCYDNRGSFMHMAVDYRVEFQCHEGTWRTVRTVVYSSKSTAQGNIVSDTAASAAMAPVVAGTLVAAVYKIACVDPRRDGNSLRGLAEQMPPGSRH